ncbi:MAG: DUF3006 domain-containing protein [Actinomycetota bacterium]|nr:DUF3006 domain-containing protein [Actinomycetota bacterium]
MRIQIDRFEDGGWTVVSIYPEGRKTFDVPRETLPDDASSGDVFDVNFERNEEETKKNAAENRKLMDELLGRDER